jgi:hypothetical protein
LENYFQENPCFIFFLLYHAYIAFCNPIDKKKKKTFSCQWIKIVTPIGFFPYDSLSCKAIIINNYASFNCVTNHQLFAVLWLETLRSLHSSASLTLSNEEE